MTTNYTCNESRYTLSIFDKNVHHHLLPFQIITSILKQKTNAEWDRIFGGEEPDGERLPGSRKRIRAKFPYGPVNNLSEVFQDSQVRHNQTEIVMEHENVGNIKQVLHN